MKTIINFRFQLTLMFAFAFGVEIASEITIARYGQAAAVVVVASEAGPAVRHAAEELSSFLEQVSGASFKIMTEPEPGTANLFVGPGAAKLADLEFSAEGLGTDGIRILTVNNGLILAGGEPRGTLYAVYTFLSDKWGGHTFWTLIPPEIYAADHPEWFAEVDGERSRSG
jgi:hypothetical protein